MLPYTIANRARSIRQEGATSSTPPITVFGFIPPKRGTIDPIVGDRDNIPYVFPLLAEIKILSPIFGERDWIAKDNTGEWHKARLYSGLLDVFKFNQWVDSRDYDLIGIIEWRQIELK